MAKNKHLTNLERQQIEELQDGTLQYFIFLKYSYIFSNIEKPI
jgi:hypothetical protein